MNITDISSSMMNAAANSKEQNMITDISSSMMNATANAVDALVPNTVSGKSPQVTSNAHPFDQHGASAAGGAARDGGGQSALSAAVHALQLFASGALFGLPFVGAALASSISGTSRH